MESARWGSTRSHSGARRRLKAATKSWHLAAPPGTVLEERAHSLKAWPVLPTSVPADIYRLEPFSVIVMAAISLAAAQYWWRSKLTNWRILMWQLITLWWWERESRRPAAISSLSTWKGTRPRHLSDSQGSPGRSWQRICWHPARRCSPPAMKIRKKKKSGWKRIGQSRQCQPPRWFSVLKILAAITCLLSCV